MELNELVKLWQRKAASAAEAAHSVLANEGNAAASRIVRLDATLDSLQGLPVDVQGYFKEGVKCLEYGLRKAAIVYSWSGFFHLLAEHLVANYETALRAERPNWTFSDASDLKESENESNILVAAAKVRMLNRATRREYDGMLSTRNRCAHPTLYDPPKDFAIGYVDRLLDDVPLYL